MLKARAVSSERIGIASVAVDSVCHVEISGRVLPRVVCAAAMSFPDRRIWASTYSEYMCWASRLQVLDCVWLHWCRKARCLSS